MTKKIGFLPAVKNEGYFRDTNSFDIGTEYMDNRDRLKLMMPDRAYKKGIPKWYLQKTCDGDTFLKSTKQEAEVYDYDYLKYMRTMDRGITKPKPLSALRIDYDKIDIKKGPLGCIDGHKVQGRQTQS